LPVDSLEIILSHYLLKMKKLSKEEMGTIYFISDIVELVPLISTVFLKKLQTITHIARACVLTIMIMSLTRTSNIWNISNIYISNI